MRNETLPSDASTSQQAVMFVDISGSTKLYGRLGDAPALTIFSTLIESLVPLGTDRGGRLIKTIGDEIMMWFGQASSAVDAAIAMHQFIEAREAVAENEKLTLRIGLCAGPMEHRDNDVFGNTVNLAARLTGLAKARSITTDVATLAHAARADVGFRRIGRQTFSGIATPIECVEILWTTVNLTDGEPVAEAAPSNRQLSLRFRGQEILLPIGGSVRIGRSGACDLTTPDERVSQQHASISSTVNNFVLSDDSLHGLALIVDGRRTVLKREKTTLAGSGQIILNADANPHPDRTIDYAVVEIAE